MRRFVEWEARVQTAVICYQLLYHYCVYFYDSITFENNSKLHRQLRGRRQHREEQGMALMGEQPEFVARLAADGAACIRGAFDAGWVELARAGIQRHIAQPSPVFRNQTGSTSWRERVCQDVEKLE